MAQISFKEDLKSFLAMKTNHRNFPVEIENVKKKGSSCNIRENPLNKWERELSTKNNSYEEWDTKEANAQM